MTIVIRIHRDPNQSINPKSTPKKTTAVIAAESGSAHASKLVSEAER